MGELQPEPAPRSLADVDLGGARGARDGRPCASANVVGERGAFGARSAGACLSGCMTLIESSDEKARSVLEDLLLRFPNFVDGWREIAEVLRKAGHPKTAVLAFARAAEFSADPMDYARLGVALQAADRPREAIVAFRRTLEAAPDLAEARAALGACLRQTGEPQSARAELERAANASARRWARLVRAWTGLRRPARHARRDPGLSPVHRGAAEHS